MAEQREVVIVGAGASGLAAARALRQSDVDTLVLERAERLGGRIHTSHPVGPDLPVELGAEFLHGDAPITRALLDEFGLRHLEADAAVWRASAGRITPSPRHFQQIGTVLARIDTAAADRSFRAFLAGTKATAAAQRMALRFVEGFHAADAARISAHSVAAPAGEVAEVRRSGHVLAGQHALVAALAAAAAVEIRTGMAVERIAWRRGGCEISGHTREGAPFSMRSRAVVITVSIGVLQHGRLRLEPEPPGFQRALALLAMGDVVRIPFIFDRRFWEDPSCAGGRLRTAGFIHTPDSPFNVWWTQYPVLAPMLVAWAGGTAARRLLALSPAQGAARALADLAAALGMKREAVERSVVYWQTHDWSEDPGSRGAYSYALVGGGQAAKSLARAHEGTLALAGEALAAEGGTVEGALASGRRAARALLRSW